MYGFYIIALMPILIGGLLWIFDKKILWWEWVIGSVLALILATAFNYYSVASLTADTETWSGYISDARHDSKWKEYYEYAVYRTVYYTVEVSDGKGHYHSEERSKQVFDHWEPTSEWHDDSWNCNSTLDKTYPIDENYFNHLAHVFDNLHSTPGERSVFGHHNSRMIEGDPNDYVCNWRKTKWIEPVTTTKAWVNKIKAAPTIFNFVEVPTNIPVYSWPNNPDEFHSDRVLGTAQKVISTFKWDQLNAVLGPTKKVNLIIVGFNSPDENLGKYQQAKFVGGKKNDLVITFGGSDAHKPEWCYVFGWTESELAKQDISSYIMEKGISTNIYSYLTTEINQNYKIKDWTKFDYVKVEVPGIYYLWFTIILFAIQAALYAFFQKFVYVDEEFDKPSYRRSYKDINYRY